MAFTVTEALDVAIRYQTVQGAKYQKNETREGFYGALDSIAASTPMILAGGVEEIKNLREAAHQAVKIPVFTKTSRTAGTAYACEGSETDSTAIVTPTFAPTSMGFKIPASVLASGNMMTIQNFFDHQMSETLRILHEGINEDVLAFYDANISQVNAGTINTFNPSTDTMQSSLANKNFYFGNISAEMKQNKFAGPYYNIHTLGDQGAMINFQTAQGTNNSTNLSYQQPEFIHYGDSQFAIPTGTTSASYIMTPGTVGIIPWYRKDFNAGFDNGTHRWDTMVDPRYPWITWAMKISTGCEDQSSLVTSGDYNGSYYVAYHFVAEFSYISAYTSNTDTYIYKYAQMTA